LQYIIKKDKRVVNVTTFYGSGSPRFQTSYAPQVGGSNYAQCIVNTNGNADTEALLDKFAPIYTNYFPDATIRFKQLDYSEANSPIEIRFSGENLSQLHQAADQAMTIMRHDPKLMIVRSNFEANTNGMDVLMNSDEANRLGINKTMLAMNLATRFGSGITLTSIWEGDYPVNVMLKDNHAGLQCPEDLSNATISGIIPGVNVPLRQIAKVKPDWSDGMIVRRNGVRTVSIFADVTRGTNLNSATDKVLKELSTMKLPSGVTMSPGGQRENDLETGPQIYGGLAISIVVIFAILLFHFKDIRLSILVLFSLLFSLLGAATGVSVMGQELGITGILGIISLMGIIVRNGIIMIDYAEELRVKHRMSAKHAALQAAQRRMRPIFLTSAAASMGVVPMVIANTPMWGPMGTVVCFGTIISMFFIITMIPIGYWIIFRIEDHKRNLKNEKQRSAVMNDRLHSLVG